MAISPTAVGMTTDPLTVTIERGRLRLFAKATGQSDPSFTDVDVALASGHKDLPVPPTFLFGLELEQPDPFGWMVSIGIDLNTVLHGTQSFEYHQTAYAGDTLVVQSKILNVYEKKGGALEFIERQTEVTRDGEPVVSMKQTVVVRNAVAA